MPSGRIRTSNPVDRGYYLNQKKAAWYKVMPWLYGGPTLCDLMGGTAATLNTFASGSGWTGASAPGGFGSIASNIGGGSTSNVLRPTGLVLPSTDWAVAAWGLCLATNSTFQALFAADSTQPFLGVTAAGLPFFQTSAGPVTGTVPVAGSWHRYLGQVSSTTGTTLWIDGQMVGSIGGTSATTSGSLGMLAASSNLYTWDGFGDDWTIYLGDLSPAEVMADYDEAIAGYPRSFARQKPARSATASPGGGGGGGAWPGFYTDSSMSGFDSMGF